MPNSTNSKNKKKRNSSIDNLTYMLIDVGNIYGSPNAIFSLRSKGSPIQPPLPLTVVVLLLFEKKKPPNLSHQKTIKPQTLRDEMKIKTPIMIKVNNNKKTLEIKTHSPITIQNKREIQHYHNPIKKNPFLTLRLFDEVSLTES